MPKMQKTSPSDEQIMLWDEKQFHIRARRRERAAACSTPLCLCAWQMQGLDRRYTADG
jgi:hypothetical protein